ncbi:cell envelope integrity protein CreD [Massilia sp. PAMC28688]|uniref:cell envelope integrity protein CreD n=1 Tax=Massilia sp. PAMC28688 TaxID=2861283 RepID=UPI001C627C03|nr:cell envelope integrity protein CreD [Massilia sp. PAMC28688]QYF94832.1 cell envelope integrity protein CreD [Massilia sp. PAMC28688]
MQRTLLFKTIIVLALAVLICIPLSMIEETIEERGKFRHEAVASIAATSVREQTIMGPVLVIPYTDEYQEQLVKEEGGTKKTETVTHTARRTHLVFPEQLKITSQVKTDRRYRGIHQVLVYGGTHDISGDFAIPAVNALPRAKPDSRITIGRPSVAMGISDVRGIRNIPTIKWGDGSAEFEQGTGLLSTPAGLHAKLAPMTMESPAAVQFSMMLGLDGIERQHFVPIGKSNKVTVKSDWPHPQFGGDFLPSPSERRIDDTGFEATWNISSLSTMSQKKLRDMELSRTAGGEQPHMQVEAFTVAFIEPVNIYTLAGRAVKYGFLFVALTFAAFFMFEMLKRLPIHPVQYLLVGLALALFFLLLVSLSEHIAFALAYLAASVACILLLGFYLSFVLRDWTRGMAFGGALTLLYGALYGLLISENNALVMGSLLLFAMLAAVMIATRKVDWYQITRAAPPEVTTP